MRHKQITLENAYLGQNKFIKNSDMFSFSLHFGVNAWRNMHITSQMLTK